jgi:hypothetical protein
VERESVAPCVRGILSPVARLPHGSAFVVLCQPTIAMKLHDFPRVEEAATIGVMSSLPLQFLLLTVAGWMTRDHQRITEYLLAENAGLRQQLRGRRLRYTDAQRRRLATAAKKLGRKALTGLDTLVTPDTLLRWYRRLIARKYAGRLHAAAADLGATRKFFSAACACVAFSMMRSPASRDSESSMCTSICWADLRAGTRYLACALHSSRVTVHVGC